MKKKATKASEKLVNPEILVSKEEFLHQYQNHSVEHTYKSILGGADDRTIMALYDFLHKEYDKVTTQIIDDSFAGEWFQFMDRQALSYYLNKVGISNIYPYIIYSTLNGFVLFNKIKLDKQIDANTARAKARAEARKLT